MTSASGSRRVTPFASGLRQISALICGCAAAVSVAAAQTVTVVDDRGRTVTLARPAQRIVALAPSLAELAFAAGAGSRLVGVARYSDYPPAARALPLICDAARVDFERVAVLRPDLVLAWRSGNPAAGVERLERLGYPAFVSEPARLADIPRVLRGIGRLAGTDAAAAESASKFERSVAALRARYAGARRIRVFYPIWHQPLLTVNGAHMISDVITLCGGANVFADLPQLTPAVSLEAVIVARPEAILGGSSAGGEQALAAQWRASPVAALRALPVRYIDPDLIQRPSPRILEGAKAVCAALEGVRANRPDAKRSKVND